MSKSKLENRVLPLSAIEPNDGQVSGLPSNPREWRIDDLESLKKSIEETPELLEARGLIVYEFDKGRYVVLGGNMRLNALRELGKGEAPCIILPEGTSVEKMKEIVIKDNGKFGEWDWALLIDEWDIPDMKAWGVASWQTISPFTAGVAEDSLDNLPDEIAGEDLTPDDLPDMEGEDDVLRDRIIITYTEDSRWILEEVFGVRDITSKVVWRLEEIMQLRDNQ